ncbi:fatty acid desaturase [Arthrospira platensis]|uniref:fatty acid desaturase n=1 Tax=Limnospira TaxID=2596745 RepID=UPI0007A0EC7A|nr:fatty acid desaturase [Arthrospira platensis]AMW27073.1 fatty acid desaturase [Arthrospira platensis YZ]MBD2669954.1 fatty acid desaturase [Arthrospira platensis FACHB-439]MBD2710533.1 fatty acid desaturase [Arthrospira platensis FACHB-835]MDT9181944.1 fatty acid desaturase [Limnospira sp. PMC 289.06]MDT9295253.1 fatty acid desaturase [Arthrospira platensis PCC 7345]QQW29819.1 fatty acid desaturase [Arthrospira sp. PCC 9108]
MTLSIVKSEDSSSPPSAVPSDLRLRDIINTLPSDVFVQDRYKAWMTVIINVLMVGLGWLGIAIAPWFLLPVLWVFTGTALTGFFVIGHDCGHRSFSRNVWVNDWVGHIMFLPIIYPFHSWRIGHNQHHKYTNRMGLDNAWQPWRKEEYQNAGKLMQVTYDLFRGRAWWIGSILHWASLHFDWTKFEGKQRQQVKFSSLLVIGTAAIAFPTMILTIGVWGFVKFWLLPWLVFHFWMSTFTLLHHTITDIPFREPEKWHEAESQLSGTVHCNYPRWVEFLCHDINVHVPHHVTTAIPWYNLRKAYASLQENWGEYLYPECDFSWGLMKEVVDHCHLYDENNNYQSIPDYKKSLAVAEK